MPPDPGLRCLDLQLPLSRVLLPLRLTLPTDACGLVLFVHGSGSNRFSQRNQAVSTVLQHAHLATVLFDLLTDAEQQHPTSQTPDLMELSRRLLAMIEVLQSPEANDLAPDADLAALPLGLFGSSSGAAVALAAASQPQAPVQAIVSRGGRPDLVSACLGQVHCPTLLMVGSHDVDVLELNTWAAARLQGIHELRVVPGAGHLFAEPGALDQAALWSQEWFLRHLRP